MNKKKVLFLCTGNSCRSQMAEAIVNHRLGERWAAQSAGTDPSGYVHPLAIKALAEIGIEHTGRSKSVDELRKQGFDLVIAVCDDAAENCPLWLEGRHKLHIGFRDPAQAEGSETKQLDVFRSVRDEIAAQIPSALESLEHDHP